MAVPAGVVVARLGGDEFALLVPDLEDRDALVALGDAIQGSCHAPFRFEGLGIDIDASIGFAVFPDHGTDAVTLLQRADVAMYTAKASARTGIEVYDARNDIHDPRRLVLAGDLRLAIDTDDLTLHFQPQARLSDGEIIGTEALVRWYHPELGPVLPDEFIPLVERTGLIKPFTDWVLRSSIAQLAAWSAKGLDLGVSVNLSMRNLLDSDLPARVRSLLFLHRVDPRRITLEVTESSIMSDPAKVVKVLEELATLGCRLSIDDFGTGYSSLAYLQRLPVHEIKIDKSFVFPLNSDRGAAAIVASVIDLARNLDLIVLAEGVEDRRCWDRLAELGCDRGQGYYLSRAIPAKELEDWLHDRSRLRAKAG
jgi:predicted signal transduction protein with EAL and GGDEF domain